MKPASQQRRDRGRRAVALSDRGNGECGEGRAGVREPGGGAVKQGVAEVWRAVRQRARKGSRLLVISKGDPALVRLPGYSAWHYPRGAGGGYAGYHPACSLSAVAHLEALRAEGAEYLVIPAAALWWLEHYRAFRQHLDERYVRVTTAGDVCRIYSLRERPVGVGELGVLGRVGGVVAEFRAKWGRDQVVLDWGSGLGLVGQPGLGGVFEGMAGAELLPYLDGTVDLVVVGPRGPGGRVSEARRVAGAAVIEVRGEGEVSVEWLRSATARAWPTVTLIIPCHNGWDLTRACLDSVTETVDRELCGEVVVVDDGSTDETAAQLRRRAREDDRLRVIRARRNRGYVDSCNLGASRASGEILVFLNNDVVLLPGWLPPMLRLFMDWAGVGAVGGRLIATDGSLQEAGGVVFCDGSAMNYGRGETDLLAPFVSHVREVDYCSGALLATPRELFSGFGGYDVRYRPAYYEDTDYCFRLRDRGYRVMFQPEAAVVHREGGTSGTDLGSGVKRYQEVNRRKFVERWGEALRGQPARPAVADEAALAALAWRVPTRREEVAA
jgi:GT2 family glycosyltransferase